MAKTLKTGDRVAWDTGQGETQGKVVRKQTTETCIKGHKVAASKENPEYIVRSDKSGKTAAHKPDGLKKGGAKLLRPFRGAIATPRPLCVPSS
jgi:hypothetical protein